jgi:hypothetical protein
VGENIESYFRSKTNKTNLLQQIMNEPRLCIKLWIVWHCFFRFKNVRLNRLGIRSHDPWASIWIGGEDSSRPCLQGIMFIGTVL